MCLLAGDLDEALLAERALARTQAVAVTDAHLAPFALGVARRRVTLTAAADRRLPLGPGAQLQHLLAQRALGDVDEGALVVGDAGADPVEARVVGAALEHGVGDVGAGVEVLDRLDQPRDVALDQLVLEGEGRGGDDDPVTVQQARHQVGQRLAGAGAGLDEQVTAVLEGGGDRLGHLDLAVATLPTERVDGDAEHLADGL